MTVSSNSNNDSSTTAPEKKKKAKNSQSHVEEQKRERQAKEDLEKFLKGLFEDSNHEKIAKAATRHASGHCFIHGMNCKHNLFQCSIYDRLENKYSEIGTKAKSLVEEDLPNFEEKNDSQYARRTKSTNNNNYSSTYNDTRGEDNNNTALNKVNQYTLSPNPSIINNVISSDARDDSPLPPSPSTAPREPVEHDILVLSSSYDSRRT